MHNKNKRRLAVIEEVLSSSTSEEEDEIALIYNRFTEPKKQYKIMNFVAEVVSTYTDSQFKEHFRVNQTTCEALIRMFTRSRFFPKNRRGKRITDARTHILSFLWYVGNKCVFRDVADRFGVTRSTLHLVIMRVLKKFLSIIPNVIKFPETEEEKQVLTNRFQKISGSPGVIGCVDGCYIEIKTPNHKLRTTYTNRHDKASVTLQGICDENRKFLDIFTGISSKIHDSRVFRLSFIYEKVMDIGANFHFLGDAAYPLKINLITPFRDYGNLTNVQRNYNYKLSATRVLIENTFGILKARFRQLMKLETHTVLRMAQIIISCCVLHNICIDQDDDFDEDDIPNEEVIDLVDPNELSENEAVQKRNEIAQQ